MKRILFLFFLFATVFVGSMPTFAGFGVTPPYVRNYTLTRGSDFTQEIILVRGDPVEDLKGEVTINVPGIDDWFSIDKGLTFTLPKGEKQVPLHVTLHVPDDAEYGDYSGNIRVRTSSFEGASSGVSIALGAQIDVDLKVADKVYDFEVRRVELIEAEEKVKKWWLDFPGKITFVMQLENTGNAEIAPSRVHFDIYNKKGDELLESVDHTNKIERIEPFGNKKVSAYLPTHLPAGAYLVRYSVYNGDVLKRSGELTLSILRHGLVPGYEGYGFGGLSLGDKATIIVPFAILILLLVVWVIRLIIRKRKKKKDTMVHSDQNPPMPPPQKMESRQSSHGNIVDLSDKGMV